MVTHDRQKESVPPKYLSPEIQNRRGRMIFAEDHDALATPEQLARSWARGGGVSLLESASAEFGHGAIGKSLLACFMKGTCKVQD